MNKINSRDINDLFPELQDLCKIFIENCKSAGINVFITSTFRNAASQDDLYAQGRTKKGNKVTNAKGGQSMHQFRCAFDFVPYVLKDGKQVLLWDNNVLWSECGKIGKELGLEWGGDWTTIKDKPHFQYTEGLTLGQLRSKYGVERPRTW